MLILNTAGPRHHDDRHGATRIVTPNTPQDRADHENFARHPQLSTKARAANASRWSGQIANESPSGDAWRNAARRQQPRPWRPRLIGSGQPL